MVLRHFFTSQFLKFLIVGATAAILHWIARFILDLWMSFSLAVALAYGVGMIVAFILNAIYVFPNSDKPRASQARDFIFVNLAFFPVVWAISVFVEKTLRGLGLITYAGDIAHALAIPIPMLATFLIYKFFAFKEIHKGPTQ